jgi:hypothetical protein
MQQPSFPNNIPAYIRLPGAVVSALAGHYANKLPEWVEPYGMALGYGLAIWIVVASIWHWGNIWREKRGKARLTLDPIHIIVLGLVIALAGVGWQIWRGQKPVEVVQAAIAAAPANASIPEKPKTKTHPHDIPKKLTVLDEHIMPLIRDEGEIELHLRRGRELLNNWKRGVSEDRQRYLEELEDYKRVSSALFDRLYKIGQANPQFEDIAALLDIGNSPYKINETYAYGLADFASGIRAFGDPPYNNMNHKYFMEKGRNQMFSSGLANYGSWLQATRKAATELRKKVASGEG